MRELSDPDLFWQDGIIPVSSRFDDPYYSREGGLAESNHVFLSGVNLPREWVNKSCYTLVELGFGTGLNFLSTWRAWRNCSHNGRLNFVSIEAYPVDIGSMRRAHQAFPEISELSEILCGSLPQRRPGYHLVRFDNGRVSLLLIYLDVLDALSTMQLKANAWYLDGFSPAKNPEMWTSEIFHRIGTLSLAGAQIATFSVASNVKRGLQEAGFEIKKRRGFGSKRECLKGSFKQSQAFYGGHNNPLSEHPPLTAEAGPIAVIGAGVAGMSVARALIDVGVEVLIFDQYESAGEGTSATPAGILQPRPLSDGSAVADFFSNAFNYASASYDSLDDVWESRGVLVLGRNDPDKVRYERLSEGEPIDVAGCRSICGVDLKLPGIWFAKGGVLKTNQVCMQLGTGSVSMFGRSIVKILRDGTIWRLVDDHGYCHEVAAVVLACGIRTSDLCGFSELGIQANRGQLTLLKASKESTQIKKAITFGGYLTPAIAGYHILGATFDRVSQWSDEKWKEIRADGHDRNIESIKNRIPSLGNLLLPSPQRGWSGLRVTTRDRLPLIGPVPDPIAFESACKLMRYGKNTDGLASSVYQPGLYMLTGLGSRGFLTAPLAGEILVSQMFNQRLPVPRELMGLVHPGRFLMRDTKQR